MLKKAKQIFINDLNFLLVYFVILISDILVKLNLPIYPYRFISKPLVIIFLFSYYWHNKNYDIKSNRVIIFLGLGAFFLGDLFIIDHNNFLYLFLSLIFFSIGKILFCVKFSHKKDFNIMRLVPFSFIMFAYTLFLINIVFKNLNSFFIPAMITYFLTLLMFQFAFLRKGVVNKNSYLLVFFGILLFIFSESIMAIKTFNLKIPFQDILIMFLYGSAMYLIVLGIIKENNPKFKISSHI